MRQLQEIFQLYQYMFQISNNMQDGYNDVPSVVPQSNVNVDSQSWIWGG